MLYGFRSVDVAFAVIFMTVVVFGKFAHLISVTNNFDATDRRLIIASVDAPKTKYLQTTTREAESLNGLYHAYAANSGENDNKLVVFGTGMGLYLILDTEPFTRAWVTDTSMSKEDFSLALNDENVSSLPYIVYCRTNQYFGYDESGYDALIDMVKKNTFYGKKEVLEEYIISKNYGIAYADDYYVLFMQTGSPVDAETLSSYFW